jgi:hypothetical protein
MRDLNEFISSDEKVEFQYTYPLWLKIAVGVSLLVVGLALLDDIRAGRSFLIIIEVVMVAAMGMWLVQMLRDDGQYLVTDQRVMRLSSTAANDVAIPYAEIGEVGYIKDMLGLNGYVRVMAANHREIRIPVPMGKSKADGLMETIDRLRNPVLVETEALD